MKRLFVRVFLTLWAASALIGVAIALTEFVRETPEPHASKSTVDQCDRTQG